MVKIKNISFRYKGSFKLNLQKVNLEVRDGECILLSGRSGCGKTTLLRMINGLIPHYYEGEIEGQVFVNGNDVEKMEMYEIAEQVGTVYQNPRSQFFNIDTDSEILFGIENLAYPREELKVRFARTAKETGVENLLGKNLFHLSGGEKQKIAFASVYAMQPDIYLLDEPSANLDAHAVKRLQEQICALKQLGKTIIITEHRLYYLKEIVDRVIYLEEGRICGEYLASDFFMLPDETRVQKGLRLLDRNVELPIQKNIDQKKSGNKKCALDVVHVSAGYKKNPVIRNISFEAAGGDIIGIAGHNGAGKSTLAETLCGLNRILEGHIFYKGNELKEKQRCSLGYMVFQDVDYELFADSVRNECSYGMRGIDDEKVTRILEKLNLDDYEDRHPALLSGGQKQRLAVAVGMLCNKEILIFDEPTSGLDYDSMLRVCELIRMLAKEGKIIFIVTHDYELACNVCNRILVMDQGQLKEDYELTVETRKKMLKLLL